jgi:hypothetical protein
MLQLLLESKTGHLLFPGDMATFLYLNHEFDLLESGSTELSKINAPVLCVDTDILDKRKNNENDYQNSEHDEIFDNTDSDDSFKHRYASRYDFREERFLGRGELARPAMC